MKRKEEKRYLEKEWKAMHSHLRSFLNKGKQERLHRFRVQVKKLRALLVITDSSLEKPTLTPHFKPVRKIFRKAGEIRDAFMNLEMAKAHGLKNAEFLAAQHQKLQSAGKVFRKGGKQHLQGLKKAHLKLKTGIKAIPDIHINLYYQKQLQEIATVLAKNTFDDRLHVCRKEIKMLIYTYPFVAKKLDLGFNEAYLEDIQTAIGDWHDHQVAVSLLTNEGVSKTILNRMIKKNNEQETTITALIKDFYNRATTMVELPLQQID